MKDVEREPFILLEEAHCLGEQIVSFCKQQSCLRAVSCRTTQLVTVQEMVAVGHGVSLVPEMAAAAAADRSGRCVYPSRAPGRRGRWPRSPTSTATRARWCGSFWKRPAGVRRGCKRA